MLYEVSLLFRKNIYSLLSIAYVVYTNIKIIVIWLFYILCAKIICVEGF